MKFPNVYFRDGDSRITFSPPAGWRSSGSGTGVIFIPPTVAMADFKVQVLTPANIPSISQDALGFWQDSLRSSLPEGATDLEVDSAVLNLIRICGHDTVALTFRYKSFAHRLKSHLICHRRGNELWRWQLTAPESDFAKLEPAFLSSLYTVEGLDSGTQGEQRPPTQ